MEVLKIKLETNAIYKYEDEFHSHIILGEDSLFLKEQSKYDYHPPEGSPTYFDTDFMQRVKKDSVIGVTRRYEFQLNLHIVEIVCTGFKFEILFEKRKHANQLFAKLDGWIFGKPIPIKEVLRTHQQIPIGYE